MASWEGHAGHAIPRLPVSDSPKVALMARHEDCRSEDLPSCNVKMLM